MPALKLSIWLLATSTLAYGIEQRDSCSSGSHMITQVTLGKTYEVCCPGTAQSIGDIQYCCVGGNEKQEKRDVCFPWCFSTGTARLRQIRVSLKSQSPLPTSQNHNSDRDHRTDYNSDYNRIQRYFNRFKALQ
ncbi:hypothetical protein N7509_003167 [Penicillium cosmopolitanum]|uniref:Uncharacterized protein n=1 Tax=Penicillium cosmopolitanum TaxID=1131564 RepID=A0A9W9W4T1_9EURO|nr:uncharacterized protein N7509_003167 [Penicillium cosmopolitanum]KAJ5403296.1 hypothetical protein N7509_003167 [Penicillium cosmopolitanum]